MSYGMGGNSNNSGAASISADIQQVCVAQDVGYDRCLVLAHAQKSGFRDGPWITQALLRDVKGATPGCKLTLAMGETGCFLHMMEGKGAFVVCLTDGRKNLPATYGFMDAVLGYYDGSPGMKGKYSDVDHDNPPRSQDGGMKAIMTHWNDPNVMRTEKLKSTLKATTDNLSGVINSLILRSEKLDEILDKSNDLAEAAQEVQNAAQAVYCAMLKRYYKWIALIVLGIIIFIAFIVGIACGTGACGGGD